MSKPWVRYTIGIALWSVSTYGYATHYDLVLLDGQIYDGSGNAPFHADIGINKQHITFIGDINLENPAITAGEVVDAKDLAVAPGFINMLSWATESLLVDGASQSNIRQGVTLEVFGEGSSMGPINAAMRQTMLARQRELKFAIPWTTLGEYLDHLVARGVAPNVASFIGATTVLQIAPPQPMN